MNPGANAFIIVVALAMLLGIGVAIGFILRHFRIWFHAYLSDVPIPLGEVFAMRFRRVNAAAVVRALIIAKQGGGVDLSYRDMERAFLQGANLDKLARAAIEAKRTGIEITFDELVDADRQDRLGRLTTLGDGKADRH